MKLLLISNSTNPGEDYLGWTLPFLEDFLKNNSVKTALFVPYAGVRVGNPQTLKESYDNLFGRAQGVFEKFNVALKSIHQAENPAEAVQKAECVIVSGGNTFHLVYELHRNKVMDVLRNRAKEGMPFIGWSAGSNIACPTLRTTNDMPIIEPESFNCLNLVPFQINPHYLDTEKHPVGFGGETREDRINEFLAVNKEVTIVGLREASLLEINGNTMTLKAQAGITHGMRVFRYGKDPEEVPQGDVSSFFKIV